MQVEVQYVVTNHPSPDRSVQTKIRGAMDDLRELDNEEKADFKRRAQEVVKTNLISAQNNVNQFRPVYKIAITYPVGSRLTGDLKTYTKIVADTTVVTANVVEGSPVKKSVTDVSKIFKRAFGLGISDVLGIWVDSDDVATPDKATVIFRVDPKSN